MVAPRKRLHGVEAANPEGGHGRLTAAGDHHICAAAANELRRFSQRMGAGGAGRYRGPIGALGAKADGDLPSREVDDDAWNEEGRDLPRTALERRDVVLLDDLKATQPSTDDDADPLRRFLRLRDDVGRVLHRHVRRSQREVDEAVVPALLFVVEPERGLEVFDLTCEGGLELRGIPARDARDTALAGHQGVPGLFETGATGRN